MNHQLSPPRSLASAIHSSPKALMPSSLGSEDITMYIWRRESEAQQLVELQFAFSHFLHGRRHPHEPYSVYFRIFPIVPSCKSPCECVIIRTKPKPVPLSAGEMPKSSRNQNPHHQGSSNSLKTHAKIPLTSSENFRSIFCKRLLLTW